jgi:hypothetical protein
MQENDTTQSVVNLDDDDYSIESILEGNDIPFSSLPRKQHQSVKNPYPAKCSAPTKRQSVKTLESNAKYEFHTPRKAINDNQNGRKPTGHRVPVLKRSDNAVDLRSLDAMMTMLEDSDDDFIKETIDYRAQSKKFSTKSNKRKRNNILS